MLLSRGRVRARLRGRKPARRRELDIEPGQKAAIKLLTRRRMVIEV